MLTELQISAIEFANQPHASDHEDDVEEQSEVVQKGVDAEHDSDDRIITREVAEIVVNSRLHLGKVGGLRKPLHVEELGNRPQVSEAAANGSLTETGKPVAEVQARRQHVYRDLNACHFE